MTRRCALIYPIILTALLAVTATVPASAKTTIKDEIEIGKKTAKEIEKQYPPSDNKEWQAEIDRLGKMLIPNVKRKEIPYSFTVLKEQNRGKNEIDAFSLPGGPVFMSERLWRLLTRDERIGVLGHEITHIDKRHAIDTMSEAQRRSLWTTAILIVAGAKGNWWNASDLANQMYTMKFSRKRETEADMGGVDLCVAAGQTPAGLVTSLAKIMQVEKANGGDPPRILASHPATKDRVDYLTKRCLELGVKPADLDPKYPDRPDRLGDVVSKAKNGKEITVSTTKEMAVKDAVWIRRPLWDDTTNSVQQLPIAKGVVKTAGSKPNLSITMEPGFDFVDIEMGDGIYPRDPDPVTAPAPPAPNNKK